LSQGWCSPLILRTTRVSVRSCSRRSTDEGLSACLLACSSASLLIYLSTPPLRCSSAWFTVDTKRLTWVEGCGH
jgi:hypothetical protein